MRKIRFNTNRGYSEEGQIIEAEEFGPSYDTFDFFDPPEEDQYVVFEDLTRHIKGKILFCKLDEYSIMRNYDQGNYEPI